MFRTSLLGGIRTSPTETTGLIPESVEREFLRNGDGVVSESGRRYEVRGGYLDLIGEGRMVGSNIANLTNYLPGAGAGYEPLWRGRSLSLLTGDDFSNEREMEKVFGLASLESGGLFLDLGCSSGLYTRNAARRLEGSGDIIGIDIAPSMLKQAVANSSSRPAPPPYVRADAKRLPFADGSFSGALCGGSLNEFGEPQRVLRETSRVLKPGGRLAIMGILKATTKNGLRLQRLLSTGGINFFAPEEVTSLLSHSGFSPDGIETFGSVFFIGATRR